MPANCITARPLDSPHIPLQHYVDSNTSDTNHHGSKDDTDSLAMLGVYDGTGHLVNTLPFSQVEPFTLETLDALIEQREALGKSLLLARVATLADPNASTVEHSDVRYFYYDAHCLNKILFRCYGRDQHYLFRLYALNPMTNTDIVGDVDYFIVEREPIPVVAVRSGAHGPAPPKSPVTKTIPDPDAIVTPSGVLTLTDDARATLSDIAAVSAARRPSVMSTTSETGCLIQHHAALDGESDESLPPPRPASPSAHPLPLSRTASARSTVATQALPAASSSGTESAVSRQFAALMERSLGVNVAGIKIAELVGPNLDRVLARSAYHLQSASGVAAQRSKTESAVMVKVSTKSSDSILAKTMSAVRGAQVRTSQLDPHPTTKNPTHRPIPRSVDDIVKRTTLMRPTRTVSDRAPAAPRHPRPETSPSRPASAVRSDCHLDTPPMALDRPTSALASTTTPLHLRASVTQLGCKSGGDVTAASAWKMTLRAKAAQGPPRPTTTSADTITAQSKCGAGADAAVRGSRTSVAAASATPGAESGSKRPSTPRSTSSGPAPQVDTGPTGQPRIISGVRGLTRPGPRSIQRAQSHSNDSLPTSAPTPTYRAVYIGSDDDYLALGHIRHLFAANAVSADDMRLFAIPPEVLLEEGILLPDLVNDPDLLAIASGATLDADTLPLSPRYGTPARSAFLAQQWDRLRGGYGAPLPAGRRPRRTVGAVAALGLCALALQVMVDPHAPLVTLVAVAAALIGVVALMAVLERAACTGREVVGNEEMRVTSALPDGVSTGVAGEEMAAWDVGLGEIVPNRARPLPPGQG